MHDIPNVEVEIHKEKETQCRHCEDNWSPSHQCHKPQSHAYEMENWSKSSNSYYDNRKKKKNICRR